MNPIIKFLALKLSFRKLYYMGAVSLKDEGSLSTLLSNDKAVYYYGKHPKISYTKVSDKMGFANSTGPDQTAPEGAV